MSAVAHGPFRVPLLTAVSTDETKSQAYDCRGVKGLTGYVTGSTGVSGGSITFEEADYDPMQSPPYSGTWSPIAVQAVTADATLAVHFGGPGGEFAYSQVRARVDTAIADGTATVVLVGT